MTHTDTQSEAIAQADAYVNNAGLPLYSDLLAFVHRMGHPEAGEALILEDYRAIARFKLRQQDAPLCAVCGKPEVEAPYSKVQGWEPPLMCCAFGRKQD